MSQDTMGRLHIGVVPGSTKTRQASIVFTEHRERAPELIGGKIQIESVVVHVERQFPVLEQVRDRVVEIAKAARARGDRPCFFIDAASGMGAGLVKILSDLRANGKLPADQHRVHAYTQRGVARQGLVNAIVASYGGGKLKFAPGLPLQAELIRSLETYETTVADDGRVSYEGDEEMVLALGLSLAYAGHGFPMRYVRRGGIIVASRSLSPDPY